MSDTRSAAIQFLTDETVSALDAYSESKGALKAAQDKHNEATEKLKKCDAMASLLGLTLTDIIDGLRDRQAAVLPPVVKNTVREMVLDIARAAYPKPIRAKAVQTQLEQARGEKLHYKTIGMTLYRLSKDDLMRREGYDWFFVPPDNAEDLV